MTSHRQGSSRDGAELVGEIEGVTESCTFARTGDHSAELREGGQRLPDSLLAAARAAYEIRPCRRCPALHERDKRRPTADVNLPEPGRCREARSVEQDQEGEQDTNDDARKDINEQNASEREQCSPEVGSSHPPHTLQLVEVDQLPHCVNNNGALRRLGQIKK